MAESRDLSEPTNEALLDCTVLASGAELTEQAPDLSSHDGTLTPRLNSDVIVKILSLLPTEDISRLKTVCRAWADIIADSAFIWAHFSRPAPITGFFTNVFKPLPTSPKFPSIINLLLSSGFVAAATSHGLVCFIRNKDGVIIITNPATSHWALIPRWNSTSLALHVVYTDHVYTLIYDPDVSFHFKLVITTSEMSALPEIQLRFQIYSSETSSWTLSSPFPLESDINGLAVLDLGTCKGSKMGGGTMCWVDTIDSYDYLNGYEIASDACWMTPLSCLRDENDEIYFDHNELIARDGEIYCAIFDSKKKRVVVSRIDEEMRWVLEGEGDTKELHELSPLVVSQISYDCVRKALILGIEGRDEMVALFLSSSRVEVLYQEKFRCVRLPHANTLAPFHGGKRDDDKLLHVMKIRA